VHSRLQHPMGSRGSSTVLALAIMALLCVVFSGLLGVVGAQQKAARAQVLADLAALAASDIDRGVVVGRPCRDARAVARDNRATVVQCRVEAGVATVTVRGSLAGFVFDKTATAAPVADDVWRRKR
jgi:helicase/secretion neighborhood TadE-like protein